MKKSIFICILGIALGAADISTANELGDIYGGLDYLLVTYEEPGFDVDVSAVRGRGGIYVSQYFAVEGAVGLGITDYTESVYYNGYNVEVKFELDNYFGIYIHGEYPASKVFKIFGIVGFTNANASATASIGTTSESDSTSESDLSMGIGAEILPTDMLGINIEYMQYISKTEFEVSAFVIGLKMYF